jgi:hypothetical protein
MYSNQSTDCLPTKRPNEETKATEKIVRTTSRGEDVKHRSAHSDIGANSSSRKISHQRHVEAFNLGEQFDDNELTESAEFSEQDDTTI